MSVDWPPPLDYLEKRAAERRGEEPPRCESCGRRRETLTVVFGPRAGQVLDIAETRFQVCRSCADAADAHGFVLVEVER